MLVLTHEVGSKVKVGDTEITILKIKGGKIRLGYVGPDQVLRANAKNKTSTKSEVTKK